MASRLKKFLLAVSVFIFAVLDWAALRDIVKGKETDYSMEYAILLFSLAVFGAIFIYWAKKKFY